MADALYTNAILKIMNQSLDLVDDTIKAMLVDDSYVFDHSHTFVSEILSSEVSGTGYVSGYDGNGRKLLTGKSIDTGDESNNNKVYFKAGNLVWNGINVERVVKAIILFAEETSDSDSVLIAYKQEGGFPARIQVTDGHQLEVRWNENGLFSLSGVV